MDIEGYEEKTLGEVLINAATEMLEHAEGHKKLCMDKVEFDDPSDPGDIVAGGL